MAARTSRLEPSRETGFNPKAEVFGKRIFFGFLGELGLERSQEQFSFFRTRLEFDPAVEILGVLAEDDHIQVFRVDDRGGDALEPAHRPDAGKQVQVFSQGHV